MMNRRLFLNHAGRSAAAIGAATWLSPALAAAEESLSAKHITFGTSMPTTGPLGSAGLEHLMGIRAAFATVNKTGGINGRELRLTTIDDAYVPARTAANVKEMIDSNAAFAFVSQIGTPNTAAAIPLLEKAGVPLVGPITGSNSLRKPEYKNIFHIRPSYNDEVSRMVGQLVSMGLQNIAFVYLDNAFGKEVLADGRKLMAEKGIKTSADVPLAFNGSNAAEAVQKIIDAKAGAIFLACTGTGVTDFVLALRKDVGALPVVGMSVTYTDLQRLGQERTQGLAMAMVFPSTKMKKFALVRDYQAAMAASNFKAPIGAALESWVNAQVMIEGVKRAGRDITRDKLRASLASIRGLEIGELSLGFSQAAPFVGALPVKMGVYGADFTLRA